MRLNLYLSLLLLFFGANVASASQLKRGYKALGMYDYFKAKKMFYRAKKYNPSTAAYGLSIIYSRNDNPFYNRDSAYHYILLADSTWNTTSDRKKEKWSRFNWSKKTIDSMKYSISSQFFVEARKVHSVEGYANFIVMHPWAKECELAIESRDSLAFFKAVEMNSAEAYNAFARTYPNSRYRNLADENFYNSQYVEVTATGTLDAYLKFIEEHPNSPMRVEADKKVYELVTKPNTVQAYELFVLGYSDNEFISDGWKEYYQLYIEDYSKERIQSFMDSYPMATNLEEVKSDLELFDTKLLPFSTNEKYGFIDVDGNISLEAKYNLTSVFQNGLAICAGDSGYGFLNKRGEWQVDPLYESVSELISGRSVVEKNEKLGLIDRNGKLILDCVYEDIGDVSNGLIYFAKEDLYGYVDVNGNVKIEPQFTGASDFNEQYAVIEVDNKVGLINRRGEFVLDSLYDGLRPVNDSLLVCERDGKNGLVSISGERILEPHFSAIGTFNDGIAIAEINDTLKYINLAGEVVVDKDFQFFPNFLLKGEFINESAIVFKNGKYGRINRRGEIVSDIKYENLGLGSSVIPFKLKDAWGLMSLSNKVLISPVYSSLDVVEEKYLFAKKNDSIGVLDFAGNIIIPFAFSTVEYVKDSCFAVRRGSKYGLYDSNQLCTELKYDRIGYLTDEFVFLVQGTSIEYYDLQRKRIIKYEESE